MSKHRDAIKLWSTGRFTIARVKISLGGDLTRKTLRRDMERHAVLCQTNEVITWLAQEILTSENWVRVAQILFNITTN